MSETSRIVGPLLQFFFPDMPYETRQIVHGYVRKTAHFTEYAVLAFFSLRALSMSAPGFLQKWRYLVAVVFVALIASIDEFNQSFEASRTGALNDVFIDCVGGVSMIGFVAALRKFCNRR